MRKRWRSPLRGSIRTPKRSRIGTRNDRWAVGVSTLSLEGGSRESWAEQRHQSTCGLFSDKRGMPGAILWHPVPSFAGEGLGDPFGMDGGWAYGRFRQITMGTVVGGLVAAALVLTMAYALGGTQRRSPGRSSCIYRDHRRRGQFLRLAQEIRRNVGSCRTRTSLQSRVQEVRPARTNVRAGGSNSPPSRCVQLGET